MDTLQVDLTKLLMSARTGIKPEAGNAQTTSLLRQFRQSGGGDSRGTIVSTVPQHRKIPLPEEVDRSCYTYKPIVDKKATPLTASRVIERAPSTRTTPISSSQGNLERCLFSRIRSGHPRDCKPRHRSQTTMYTLLAREPSAQGVGVGEAWSQSTGKEGGNDGGGTSSGRPRRLSGSPVSSRCSSHQRRELSSSKSHTPESRSVARLASGPIPAFSARSLSRNGSELHEFLYHKHHSRDERLRKKKLERDKELTFHPRLATSSYNSAAAAKRRGRQEQTHDGTSIGRDFTNEMGDERHGRPEGRAPTRFEMLYQDSKAKLQRVREVALRTPPECTFQPRLSSTSRGRSPWKEKSGTRASGRGVPWEARHDREGKGRAIASDDEEALDTGLQFGQHYGDVDGFHEGAEGRGGRERALSEGARKDRNRPENRASTYPERLHQGHREKILLWAKRREERVRLELEACTFQPNLNHSATNRVRPDSGQGGNYGTASRMNRRSAEPLEEPVHDRLYQAACEANIRRIECARAKKWAEIQGCTFRPSVNVSREGRRSISPEKPMTYRSVYDRLHATAAEVERKRALRDEMLPPGCTFRPKFKKDLSVSKRANTAPSPATSPSQPPPPPPLPASDPRHQREEVLAEGYHAPPAPPECDKPGDDGSHGAGEPGSSRAIGSRIKEGEEGCILASQAIATIAEEVAVGQRKIPYGQSCFSPRRRRTRDENTVGRHEALYELGSQKQRNILSILRGHPKTFQERQEEDELKDCTFEPFIFTRGRRGASRLPAS